MNNLHFPSLTHLVEHVKALPDAPAHSYDDNKSSSRLKWTGGTFDTAYKLALDGWPEGANRAAEMSTKIVDRVVGRSTVGITESVGYDVIGAAYDAGAVALGIPEAWGVLQPQESKRAVRIVLNSSVSAGITPEVITKRGVAVAALALALQTKGYPVTVDVYTSSNGLTHSVLVRVADATSGSQLDLDRIVYALAHASMQRRLVRAAQSDYRMGASGDKWGSGMPRSNDRPEGDIDLYIGGATIWEVERWQDGGEAWVLQEYLRQTGG